MTLRSKGAWVLAGLAALVVTFVGGREAQAGSMAAGIVAKGSGGTVPGSDPEYYYQFQVYVAAGYQMNYGDYFEFGTGNNPQGLPGVTTSSTSTPVTGPYAGVFSGTQITQTVFTSPYASDVQWTYLGIAPIVGSGPDGTYVGTFNVDTTNFQPNTFSLPTTVTYSAQSHNTSTGDVYIQAPGNNPGVLTLYIVPEPSSLTLLLAGAGMLPLLLIRERRRRQRQSQSQ